MWIRLQRLTHCERYIHTFFFFFLLLSKCLHGFIIIQTINIVIILQIVTTVLIFNLRPRDELYR